ncbi:MAG TPA: glucose 1-dehydrogenase [Stellaceae bacterium]|nr:glucose 1-dehydrogenase [Stellaceae bacterium]
MGQVDGKVAIVTGGASGIGAACAGTLAREGARVVVSDIDELRGNAVAAEIAAAGGAAMFLPHDVTDEERWHEVVAEIERRFGRLDILVANAGIGIMCTSIVEMSLADWRRQTAINLDGVFLSVKHCLPLMRKSGGGSIVMTSSIAGLRGSATLAGYCATKGGVRLFAKAIAMECASRGDGVRVNSVHPGIIDTPIWEKIRPDLAGGGRNAPIDIEEYGRRGAPLGRVGKPQDIANGVLFLSSDASSYITGSELVIDGGITGGQIMRAGPLAMSSAHE